MLFSQMENYIKVGLMFANKENELITLQSN
jgi:hypothetical protein